MLWLVAQSQNQAVQAFDEMARIFQLTAFCQQRLIKQNVTSR